MFLAGITRYGWMILWAMAAGLLPTAALAQLKMSQMLTESLPASVQKQSPTLVLPAFVLADSITGQPDLAITLEGNAELRKAGTVIRTQRLHYNQATDSASATGGVSLNRQGNRYWGEALELNLTEFKGFFSKPSFEFLKNKGKGVADRLEFVDERRAIATGALFSSCRRPEGVDGKAWKPDWLLSADSIAFDTEQDVATATGATLRFQDAPILAMPSFDFPMSDARKSGWLAPSVVVDSQSGTEITMPYYWNTAPNRDITFFPSSISKRGMNLGTEFRYLEPRYQGTMRAEYLPNDRLYGDSRWGWTSTHTTAITSGLPGDAPIGLRLAINKVSDNEYWRDFPRGLAALTQRLLSSELALSSNVSGWTTQLRMQRWQTLQAQDSPITPPYDRWPQITTKRSFVPAAGWQASLEADYTQFISKPDLTLQPNAERAFALAQLSRPFIYPSGYITPKAQLHSTAYHLNSTAFSSDSFAQRSVPTLSVDSGLFFERVSTLLGRSFQQTLEPRLFYVRTPYRNQSTLPNYDSGVKDFSFSTIYSENAFVGNDRISDAHLLTLGVNSRWIEGATGLESLRAGIAQRYRFSDQLVTLPGGVSQTNRHSDWLTQFGTNWTPAWSTDGTVQFGATSRQSERTTLTTRFAPSNYRSIYGAYRLQKDVSEQLDVGWQWPLGDLFGRKDENSGSASLGQGLGSNRWYSVARLNYSIRDQRMVDAILGFEYDADCWVGRIVLEQTQTSLNSHNQRIMFQLEFSGFARVGVSPLASLRRSIPRYQNLREQTTAPSRFSQYD